MYTHVLILQIKVCPFFRNFMCNATHHKSFGLIWTAFNEVRSRIVFIPDNIYLFFYQFLYGILCLVLIFWFLPSFLLKGLVLIFWHDAFHIGFRQRTPKLILHTTLDVYQWNNFIDKGLSIFQKLHVRYGSSYFIWFGMNRL